MAIKDYKISSAYANTGLNSCNEVEIESEGLLYAEIGYSHSGCQCMNMENQAEIHKKCREISKLIKEIDALNQSDCQTKANVE